MVTVSGFAEAISLVGSAPNPFSESTSLSFGSPLPADAALGVYDLSGRLVRVLTPGAAGGSRLVVWDGRSQQGERVARGTYFIRVRAGGRDSAAKLHFLD